MVVAVLEAAGLAGTAYRARKHEIPVIGPETVGIPLDLWFRRTAAERGTPFSMCAKFGVPCFPYGLAEDGSAVPGLRQDARSFIYIARR
ncbi:hypothetical protein PG989_000718 [Apiospora arundinis]